MNSIWLVCSVHAEKGLAKASELRAILEGIGPAVIFVEVPPSVFDEYFSACSRQNLESSAIGEYRQGRDVEVVPVDLTTPEPEFFRNNQIIFEMIESESHEYRRLVDLHSSYVRAYGFPYLNSEHCTNLWSEVYEETLRVVTEKDDKRLIDLYELWKRTISLRDNGMMENVLNYCRQNTFGKGVLVVGAAHRESIVDLAGKQSAAHPTRIQWNLAGLRSSSDLES